MTSWFKHRFYKSRSVLQGPLLQQIYISIKQYGPNGFMALLALGQNGEIHTADTDRLFVQQENNIHQVLLLTAILHMQGCMCVFFSFFNPHVSSIIPYVLGGVYYIFTIIHFMNELLVAP